MTKRRKFSFVIGCCIVAALGLLLISLRDRNGTVNNFQDLPRFGRMLPSITSDKIEFVYNPRIERVLARAVTSTNTFLRLCTELRLRVIKYEKGYSPLESVIESPEYLPSQTRVWCGYGSLQPSGRSQVRVYFEPGAENTTNGHGKLFLHML